MNKYDFMDWVKLLLTPVILMLLGIVLLVSPDSAAALLVRIIGWVLIAVATGLVIWAVTVPGGLASKVIGAVIFGLAGIWMVSHPLGLAAWLGRLVGILLLIQGVQDMIHVRSRQTAILLPLLTAVAGAVLVALPMTTSRLVFRVIGAVVLAIGGFMLWDRLQNRGGGREPENPDIIDAL